MYYKFPWWILIGSLVAGGIASSLEGPPGPLAFVLTILMGVWAYNMGWSDRDLADHRVFRAIYPTRDTRSTRLRRQLVLFELRELEKKLGAPEEDLAEYKEADELPPGEYRLPFTTRELEAYLDHARSHRLALRDRFGSSNRSGSGG